MESVVDLLFDRIGPRPGMVLAVPAWLPIRVLGKLLEAKEKRSPGGTDWSTMPCELDDKIRRTEDVFREIDENG